MVKKANGKWRMCTDYTDLNKVCLKDPYPLPNIDRLVDSVSGFKFLSFMDAYSWYNQIKMHPDDEEKTAFITDSRVFCHKVMSFGLKNAGATYLIQVRIISAHPPLPVGLLHHDHVGQPLWPTTNNLPVSLIAFLFSSPCFRFFYMIGWASCTIDNRWLMKFGSIPGISSGAQANTSRFCCKQRVRSASCSLVIIVPIFVFWTSCKPIWISLSSSIG
ncbi:hypothetical protein CR513_27599, partial [Mucuna pruriens]